MLKQQRKSSRRNQKGMAAIEMIPLLMIIMLLVNFSLGFFGAIHTGILNSIASRNYTFETFRNRAGLNYFKSTSASADNLAVFYSEIGMRVHGTVTDKDSSDNAWIATARTINFLENDEKAVEIVGNESSTHKRVREVPSGRNTTVGVNPIWVKTTYGICLNAKCGS